MNSLLLTDVPFNSDEGWDSFTLIHGLSHQTVYNAMLQKNIVPTYYPLFDFPRKDNDGYLLDHWQVHQSNAQLLGIPDLPDLSTVDLSNEGEFQDWLAQHAIVHLNENVALGIVG